MGIFSNLFDFIGEYSDNVSKTSDEIYQLDTEQLIDTYLEFGIDFISAKSIAYQTEIRERLKRMDDDHLAYYYMVYYNTQGSFSRSLLNQYIKDEFVRRGLGYTDEDGDLVLY